MHVRQIRALTERDVEQLSDVLIDCVKGGASVGFMLPMTLDKAQRYWRSIADSVARGERLLLAAEDEDGSICGTVQLVTAQPENQPHRADVAKMLVHHRVRRRGVGAALLGAVESAARELGKTLLVLDTVTDSDAARLYVRHGWQRCGEIPGYAHWPDGRPCPTTVYFKALAG